MRNNWEQVKTKSVVKVKTEPAFKVKTEPLVHGVVIKKERVDDADASVKQEHEDVPFSSHRYVMFFFNDYFMIFFSFSFIRAAVAPTLR